MEIYSLQDNKFKKYGKVLKGYDTSRIVERMEEVEVPDDGIIYRPSVDFLENLSIFYELQEREFGEMPIQIGYCIGKNNLLNAFEYHRTSELNIAATDFIALFGHFDDVQDDYTYDTSNVEAFFVPRGTAIEVYATTLHYAPCTGKNDYFKSVIVLPEGTNYPLEAKPYSEGEDRLLAGKNKWVIGHKESGLEEEGGFIGLKGENISMAK